MDEVVSRVPEEIVNVPLAVVVPASEATCPELLITKFTKVEALTDCPAEVFVYFTVLPGFVIYNVVTVGTVPANVSTALFA